MRQTTCNFPLLSILPSKLQVAEVAVFDHSLTDSELNAVEEYARRRYLLF